MAAARHAQLLLGVADGEFGVDGGEVEDAAAGAERSGSPTEHHRRQADVLRHDDVARLEVLDDREVGRVRAGAHVDAVDPARPS